MIGLFVFGLAFTVFMLGLGVWGAVKEWKNEDL